MKKFARNILLSSIIIGISVNVIWFIAEKIKYNRGRSLYEKLSATKPQYAYETYLGALNSVLYFDDIKLFPLYKRYYDSLRISKKIESLGNWPIKSLPYDRPIYFFDSTSNPECVEVIFFNGSEYHYEKGLVLRELIHERLPDKKLLEDKRRFYDSLTKAENK